MFRARKRGKSNKKVAKTEKHKDGSSDKQCKQTRITKPGPTAGGNLVTSNSRDQHQILKSVSVKQYPDTNTISKDDYESSASYYVSNSKGEIFNGEGVNRHTYKLEKVSRSLDEVMASGKAILDALASVSTSNAANFEEEDILVNTSVDSRKNSRKRGTYDLDKVSDLLDSSVNFETSLNEEDCCNKSTVQRNTYDLDSVSTKLDQSVEQKASLEEVLYNLSNDDLSARKRDTYDLEKVENVIEDTLNSGQNIRRGSLEKSLIENSFSPSKRGTYDLTDLPNQLDHSIDTSKMLNSNNTASDIGTERSVKRDTYNLSNVSELLDDSLNSGKSIDNSLDQISSSNCPVELKRRTYDLTDSNLLPFKYTVENTTNNNNIVTSPKQQTNMDNVPGETVSGDMKMLTNVSDYASGKLNMCDGVNDSNMSGTMSKNLPENSQSDKPVDGLLLELGLDVEDGQRELTPGQWMKQMKELKTPPSLSPLKLKLTPKKVTKKENSKIKPLKGSSEVVETKQRSQTITTASLTPALILDSDMRSRSFSDSKVRSQLKSSSTPNFSTSTSISKDIPLSESLDDISPGIRNYLSNKLGLSEEQCIAVHRRLSNSSETAVPDVSKLANRKTYSLDDVAHSLDIATSQGLPMTKVLDNLDTASDKDVVPCMENKKDLEQKLDSDSVEQEQTMCVLVDSNAANTKPITLDLRPNASQEAHRKTYILASPDEVSPISKPPVVSLDNQLKLVRKKAVYKPSAKLHSFSHLLASEGGQVPLRGTRGRTDPLKRNTYTLESVAESLEKAQDAGVPMLDALKRLSGSYQSEESEAAAEKRKTYSLEDVSKTLETAAAAGVPIVDTLRSIADPTEPQGVPEPESQEVSPKKKAPPKPRRTFSNSNKPEIKFVSDSFVIQYYTSPKKSSFVNPEQQEEKAKVHYYVNQTYPKTSQEQNGKSVTVEDYYENQSCVDSVGSCDGKSSDKNGTQVTEIPSSKSLDGQKPSTKVVRDLDSLLLKLAAEVENPTNVDSSCLENKMDTICPSNTAVDDHQKIHIGVTFNKKESESNSVEESSKVVETLCNKESSSNSFSFSDKVKVLDLADKSEGNNNRYEYFANNNDIESFKVSSDDEHSFSGSKLDDEGYCSLSRSNSRCLKLQHDKLLKKAICVPALEEKIVENKLVLSKTEKQVTAFVKETGVSEEKVEIIYTYDENGESQECELKLSAEDDAMDKMDEEDFSDSPSKADPVSRELGLLRQRLAKKQRDIEAQKQRTKEQLEEERKRLGKNVFWLTVGQGRDKKGESEPNSPRKAKHQVNIGQPLPTVSKQSSNTSNLNSSKLITFTKQSSFDEDLPPSMGKLQDRTFNLKTNNNSLKPNDPVSKSIPEEKGPLPYQTLSPEEEAIGNHLVGDQNLSVHNQNLSLQDRNPSANHRNPLYEDRGLSEDIVQFRLSRQAPEDVYQNDEDFKSVPENLENESPNFQKPVLNYKSRINVPISLRAKPVSENCPTMGKSENFGNRENEVTLTNTGNGPTSPQRKCWDTDTAVHSEPRIAVSESNYHIFESGAKGDANSHGSEVRSSEGGGLIPRDVKHSPDEGEWSFNSSPVDEERDTPKKGLALFIGEENTVSSDGLTPEQLRKREKFLRNRQQKIEEEKIKKEVLLEKKKRKDEKMREIQLRREQEEQTRQTRLQEKREQAEQAKQERQKYEMRRKENSLRTNFIDGPLGSNVGYSRTAVNTRDDDEYRAINTQGNKDIPKSNGGPTRTPVKTPTSGGDAFEIRGPTHSTNPSAFSGFTGVQSYVKPSGKTNRKLIINAISHVCLPGVVNKDTKEKCLQAMTESSAQHFLILFKEGLKFRALYSLDMESTQVLKVHGVGPRSVSEKMIEQLYKYNSGGKEFSKIPAKSFSLSVDGFTLQKSCWQSNKPSVASKTASNYKQSSYRPTR